MDSLQLSDLLCLLDLPVYRRHGLQVALLRLDLLHPQISGNKWFKLDDLRRRLQAGERPRVLSFGGPWSNHLHALAYLGRQFGVETLGLVRGHAGQAETAMLEDARQWGMQIRFMDRQQYAQRGSDELQSWLLQHYPAWEMLPEGGSSRQAVVACREIWALLRQSGWEVPDYLMCALGTGATLAGLIAGKPSSTRVLGVPVLRFGDEGGQAAVRLLLEQAALADPGGWELLAGDCGGYARLPAELAAFMLQFERQAPVMLDPVYTAKLLACFHRRVVSGFFAEGSRILLVHTGGLQGRRGMEQRIAQRAAAFVGPLSL